MHNAVGEFLGTNCMTDHTHCQSRQIMYKQSSLRNDVLVTTGQ